MMIIVNIIGTALFWQKKDGTMAQTALVILADDFEEIEAITVIDVLRRAGVDVTVAGLLSRYAAGAHGIRVNTDAALAETTNEFDAVVLPGGMPGAKTLGDSAAVAAVVCRHFEAGKLVAAICAAPGMALAKFGVLDGRKATCYPGFEREFPATTEALTDAVVTDGNVVTSRGPGTAMAFALELVSQLCGANVAADLGRAMQVDR